MGQRKVKALKKWRINTPFYYFSTSIRLVLILASKKSCFFALFITCEIAHIL